MAGAVLFFCFNPYKKSKDRVQLSYTKQHNKLLMQWLVLACKRAHAWPTSSASGQEFRVHNNRDSRTMEGDGSILCKKFSQNSVKKFEFSLAGDETERWSLRNKKTKISVIGNIFFSPINPKATELFNLLKAKRIEIKWKISLDCLYQITWLTAGINPNFHIISKVFKIKSQYILSE